MTKCHCLHISPQQSSSLEHRSQIKLCRPCHHNFHSSSEFINVCNVAYLSFTFHKQKAIARIYNQINLILRIPLRIIRELDIHAYFLCILPCRKQTRNFIFKPTCMKKQIKYMREVSMSFNFSDLLFISNILIVVVSLSHSI